MYILWKLPFWHTILIVEETCFDIHRMFQFLILKSQRKLNLGFFVLSIVIFEFQQAFKSVLLFHKVNSFVKQNNKLGITVCILKRFEVHILKESSLLKYWILAKNYNLYSMNHNKNNKRFINWDTFILGFVELVCIY